MCFAISISVCHIVPMTETADFIDTSLAFATHGFHSPVLHKNIIWLQIRYANRIISMSLGDIPILTFVGSIGSSSQSQRTTLLQLLSEPMLALHDSLGVAKSFDMTCGADHGIVSVGKL